MNRTITGDDLAGALDALRTQVPLVHSLTNIVSANFLTNVVLAAGASNAHIDNATRQQDSPASPAACW